MRLIKYSAEPLVFDPNWDYDNRHEMASAVGKPRGFWLSDDDDWGWRDWCEAEDWNTGGLAHAAEFRLTPGHNVLLITTDEEFEAFGNEYRVEAYPGLGITRLEAIDWARVRAEYDGIVISPYQNERRFDFVNFWYAGWDVASACIWNLTAIEQVEPTCGQVQIHRSTTVVCDQPVGHESKEGRERVHQGEEYGTKVMWLGETP